MLVHASIHAAVCVRREEVAHFGCVPVENGLNKRGGRLPGSAGSSRVLPLGYKMSCIECRARAVILSSNFEFRSAVSRQTEGFRVQFEEAKRWLGLTIELNC
jgi:hypothetical protein